MGFKLLQSSQLFVFQFSVCIHDASSPGDVLRKILYASVFLYGEGSWQHQRWKQEPGLILSYEEVGFAPDGFPILYRIS
ncbi:hypothetical protein L1987_46762 [Smallanthus sonchifolius]|nr:hypothetical protein L1987_46762 [Smallanthus sonchifolius]